MIIEKGWKNKKERDLIQIQCDYCNNVFFKIKKNLNDGVRRPESINNFCSKTCRKKDYYDKTHKLVCCKNCNIKFYKKTSELKKYPNSFCSCECSGTYNSLHKKHGTRRSKLEVWLENQLSTTYPNLIFEFNQKHRINSELDIYISSLNLAFELNGIFHYEPIYGEKKFNQIQNNDNRKFQACLEKGIELCIIDVSGQKYFKETTSEKYLDIICNIINNKMSLQRDSNP